MIICWMFLINLVTIAVDRLPTFDLTKRTYVSYFITLNKSKKAMRPFFIILFSIVAQLTYGQLVTWNLGGPAPTTGRESAVSPAFVKEGLKVSDLTKGPLVQSKQGNARGFSGHLAKNVRTFDEAVKND